MSDQALNEKAKQVIKSLDRLLLSIDLQFENGDTKRMQRTRKKYRLYPGKEPHH